jgi:GNAT superfamily N-acetyltransferase
MDNILEKMFKHYSEEKGFGPRIHYTNLGFITFHLNKEDNECYIEDLYVIPEMRNKGFAARSLADKVCSIAKENGITRITGSIHKDANNKELSRLALSSYGMVLFNESEEMEFYFKEI